MLGINLLKHRPENRCIPMSKVFISLLCAALFTLPLLASGCSSALKESSSTGEGQAPVSEGAARIADPAGHPEPSSQSDSIDTETTQVEATGMTAEDQLRLLTSGRQLIQDSERLRDAHARELKALRATRPGDPLPPEVNDFLRIRFEVLWRINSFESVEETQERVAREIESHKKWARQQIKSASSPHSDSPK